MKNYITILPFYMPDGRKYENWEIVTFVNDSLKNYLLYEWYIKPYHMDDYWNIDTLFSKMDKEMEIYNQVSQTREFLEEKRNNIEKQAIREMYIHYFEKYQESLKTEAILMKDIINSISIWEFIQQKYFNSNKSIWLK